MTEETGVEITLTKEQNEKELALQLYNIYGKINDLLEEVKIAKQESTVAWDGVEPLNSKEADLVDKSVKAFMNSTFQKQRETFEKFSEQYKKTCTALLTLEDEIASGYFEEFN